MRAFKNLFIVSAVLWCAQVASGGLVNVQFEGERGTSFAPDFTGNGVLRESGAVIANPSTTPADPSGTWNHLQVPLATPNNAGSNYVNPSWSNPLTGFSTATGGPSSVALSLSNFTTSDTFNGAGGYGTAVPLYNGYLLQESGTSNFNNNAVGTATLTIGGLLSGSSYDLYLYSSNAGFNVGAAFSVNGSSVLTSSGGSGSFPNYVSGTNYVHFSGVIANGSGQLVITENSNPPAGGNGFGVLNGFQLQGTIPTPEPGSLALGMFGAVGLCLVVRRRLCG